MRLLDSQWRLAIERCFFVFVEAWCAVKSNFLLRGGDAAYAEQKPASSLAGGAGVGW